VKGRTIYLMFELDVNGEAVIITLDGAERIPSEIQVSRFE